MSILRDVATCSVRCLLGVLLVIACSVSAVAADRAHALEPGLVTDLTWFPGETTNVRSAALLADSGSRWVRLSVGWHDFEPAKGSYNTWSIEAYRREIQRARQAGQKVLLMIHETPSWASGSAERHAPPRDPQDFAHFAAYLGTLYGADVDAYEVWNEPNYARFWYPAPDAAAYARLLRAAYPAIKAVDPSASVVFAGPSTNDYAFVERAYAAGAKGFFDVMGAHPYSCYDPGTIVRDGNGRIDKGSFLGYREIRDSMLARGDDKPIWFTEFGWSTTSRSCGVSESDQAAFLLRAYALAATDPYVHVAMWYALRNWSPGGEADAFEAQFGLLRSDFTAKPAYAAFKAVTGAAPITPALDLEPAPAPAPVPAPAPAPTVAAPAPSSTGKKKPRTAQVRLSITRVSRGRIAIVRGALTGGGATDVDIRLAYVTERGAKHARTRTVRARNGRFTTRFTRLRSSRIRVIATTRL